MTHSGAFYAPDVPGTERKPSAARDARTERRCQVQRHGQGVYLPNGARLKFGYCRHDSDLLQYQGQAYDVIFLEECTQFPENVFTTMTESNRSSGLMAEHFPPRMYFTCQPRRCRGTPGFKRLFIDREYKKTEKPEHYVFISGECV